MSRKLHRLIWTGWGDNQSEVHPVWEARIIPSIEQAQELATIKKADSSQIVDSTRAANSESETSEY